MRSLISSIVSVLVVTAAATAIPVQAEVVEKRIVVSAEGLNLDRAEDRAELRDRIESAVRSACRNEGSSVIPVTVDRDCVAEARQEAMAKLASFAPAAAISAGN